MELPTAVKQRLLFNKLNLPRDGIKVETFNDSVSESDLWDVKWIWESTKIKLIEAWISTQEQLKKLSEDELKEIVQNPLSLKWILSFINS